MGISEFSGQVRKAKKTLGAAAAGVLEELSNITELLYSLQSSSTC